jgi:hypothetical protein
VAPVTFPLSISMMIVSSPPVSFVASRTIDNVTFADLFPATIVTDDGPE